MPITDRLMKPGSWSLELLPDTPRNVLAGIQDFSVLCVTPAPVDLTEQTRSSVVLAARYSGVVTGWSKDKTAITGMGIGGYLGDLNSPPQGPRQTITVGQPTTFANQMSNLFTYNPHGISWGGVIGSVPGSKTFASVATNDGKENLTVRETMDACCALYGTEWRISAHGLVTGGYSTDLFVPALYTTVVVGRDLVEEHLKEGGGLVALPAVNIEVEHDGSAWAWNMPVYTDGVYTGAATNPNPSSLPGDFLNAGGIYQPAVWHYERRSTASVAETNAIGAGIFASGIYDIVNRLRTLEIDCYDPARFITPGDYIGIYDPLNNLIGGAVMDVNGRQLSALRARCLGMTWPVKAGMGVYAIASDSSKAVTDLTPFMRWETSTTKLEVGALPRRLTGYGKQPIR